MKKKKMNDIKNESYKKWSFLRDLSFKVEDYDKGRKIQSDEIKEYNKYQFLKKLCEVVNEK